MMGRLVVAAVYRSIIRRFYWGARPGRASVMRVRANDAFPSSLWTWFPRAPADRPLHSDAMGAVE